jgi:predicted TIM-barrel enzyme
MDKMVAISAEKTNAIQAIFSRNKVVIGVIHCDPFPGTPKYRGNQSPVLLSVRFAMLKIIFQAAFMADY